MTALFKFEFNRNSLFNSQSSRTFIEFASIFVMLVGLTSVSVASGRSNDPEAREHMNYALGKDLFREIIVCSSCPYAKLELDSKSVGASWQNLKEDLDAKGMIGKNLSIGQRYAILFFVKKRFKIPDH